MAEYHVGCGAFGIYAGVLHPARKDGLQLWKCKSEVTDECICAVAQYFLQEMDVAGKSEDRKEFRLADGSVFRLDMVKRAGDTK